MIFRRTFKFRSLPGADENPRTDVRTVALEAAAVGARGWYRLKCHAENEALWRVVLEAVDKLGRPMVFEALPAEGRFSGYIYLSGAIETIRLKLNLHTSAEVSVVFRPIPLIEFVWHSLRTGFFNRPRQHLAYFLNPVDSFLIRFSFPNPQRFSDQADHYKWWIRNREQTFIQEHLASVPEAAGDVPKISLLMTVCDPQPVYLRKAIESVRKQTSPNWQLCIADDASVDPNIRMILEKAAAGDPRISLALRERRGGISAATNDAFALATSPFVACIDHDDTLSPEAIEVCARYLGANPQCRLLFSDEDMIDAWDNRFMPFFKPRRFSPELFYSCNYFNHLTVHSASTIRKIGGWRSDYDGAQDYDLNLQSLEHLEHSAIHHLPFILYHWRAIAGSAALDLNYKSYGIEAGRRALADHFARLNANVKVSIAAKSAYRIHRLVPAPSPKVSIVIPFRDRPDLLRQCVSSILDKTGYENLQIILTNNGSTDPETLALLDRYKTHSAISVISDPRPFNYSQLNNYAVTHATGDYLCFLNNDIEIIDEGWLEEMLSYASLPGVGCVGAKLYYPDRTVQHAGVVLGLGGVAGHVFLNRGPDDRGHFGRLVIASNYSAVTGACMMVKRETFDAVGGFDEIGLPIAFNDIDFCIKVQNLGMRNVFTPFAELVHWESATRGREDTPEKVKRFQRECEIMKQRHGDLLLNDPFYSPRLTLELDDFSLRLD